MAHTPRASTQSTAKRIVRRMSAPRLTMQNRRLRGSRMLPLKLQPELRSTNIAPATRFSPAATPGATHGLARTPSELHSTNGTRVAARSVPSVATSPAHRHNHRAFFGYRLQDSATSDMATEGTPGTSTFSDQPPPALTTDEKQWAMFCHLSAIV